MRGVWLVVSLSLVLALPALAFKALHSSALSPHSQSRRGRSLLIANMQERGAKQQPKSEVELSPLLSQQSPGQVPGPDVSTSSDAYTTALSTRPTDQNNSSKFEIFAILTVYFVQGALGLSRLALSFFMKDSLHLSPADMAAMGGITTLPWVVKPLYGFLSDGFPILGYRRRSYLVIAGGLGCLSWLALAFGYATTYSSVLVMTVLGSISVAMSDVVVDSIVVERSRIMMTTGADVVGNIDGNGESTTAPPQAEENENSKSGDLQSMCWASAAVGGILSAYFSGSLLAIVKPETVFLITAAFPLLISLSGFLIDEKPVTSGQYAIDSMDEDTEDDSKITSQQPTGGRVSLQLSELWRTIKNPAIYLPALFVFGWQATPSADSALFFFTTNDLHFEPEFLGQVRLCGSLASLAGVVTYRFFLKEKPIKDIIFWTTFLSIPLGLTQALLTSHVNRQLGIPDKLFALTDTVVLSVLGQIAFMPTLVLAAKLCPPGVEGTLFATIMSIFNLSSTVASELGAGLTSALGVTESNFDNLTLLVVICTVSNALPLFFINLLNEKETRPDESM